MTYEITFLIGLIFLCKIERDPIHIESCFSAKKNQNPLF